MGFWIRIADSCWVPRRRVRRLRFCHYLVLLLLWQSVFCRGVWGHRHLGLRFLRWDRRRLVLGYWPSSDSLCSNRMRRHSMASLIGALTFDTSGLAQSALPTNEEVDWHGFSYSFIGPKRESISRFSVSFGVVHHFVRRSQRRFLGWFGSRLWVLFLFGFWVRVRVWLGCLRILLSFS